MTKCLPEPHWTKFLLKGVDVITAKKHQATTATITLDSDVNNNFNPLS